MLYGVIFSYYCNEQGEPITSNEDVLGVIVVEGDADLPQVAQQGILDPVLEQAPEGSHIKFELYNIKYDHPDKEEENVCSFLMSNISDLIDNGKVEVVSTSDMFATVSDSRVEQ